MNLNNIPTVHDKENAFIDEALNPKVPMNNYEAATDEYCFEYTKYLKVFDWKAFNKFTWVQQQMFCEKYNIILINHKTKGERYRELTKGIISGMTLSNINKGIDKFNHGVDSFMKVIEATGESKTLKIPNYKEMTSLLGSNKNSDKELNDLLGNKKNGYRLKF